jgi:hypothetical protein
MVFVSSNHLASSPNGLFFGIFESKYFVLTSLRSLEAVALIMHAFLALTEPKDSSAKPQEITFALHHTLLETAQ